MKMIGLSMIALSLLGAGLMAQDAVAFRFDDNQPPERWEALGEAFKKHNARFSFAVNLTNALNNGEKYHQKLCQLEQEGFEVMDHTPNHNALLFRSSDKELIAKYANAPFVDHATENTLYFKFIPRSEKGGDKLNVDLVNGCEISPADEKTKLKPYTFVKYQDKYYFIVRHYKTKKLQLVSLWEERNVNLPDARNMELQKYPNWGIPAPGSIEFLVEQTRSAAAKIGLKKNPTVWIQPGGAQIIFSADELGPILKKVGYVSAATYPNAALKGFMDPHFERNAYAMMWGPFTLENMKIEPAKRIIADFTATHRVAIGSSHIIPARKGKEEMMKYVQLHDELLTWLAENNIKVLTQSELANHLKTFRIDPKKNIFPSLTRDINGDGIPDGYNNFPKEVKITNGEVSFQKRGRVMSVSNLCALPQGPAVFSIELKGKVKVGLIFEYYNDAKGISRATKIKTEKLVFDKSVEDWTKFTGELNIPEGANCLRFSMFNSTDGTETFCRNPELCGK